jgi:poly(3-hydroxybutyrate) depolymerase
VESLRLHLEHKPPEPRDEPSPTGFVLVERGASRAVLLTPEEIDPARLYPLVTVLHGAGRQDELLVRACRDEPEKRQALFLVPRSFHPTWDLIASDERPDLDFLEWAYDLIYRRYPVDPARQALLGYSDGASYALSVGLSNPRVFRAVMGWAAGFLALDTRHVEPGDPKPAVLLEYGTHDPLFPFQRVALPMRESLERLGYRVEFRVDEGGRHWPSGTFQSEALDWFQSEPWERRS